MPAQPGTALLHGSHGLALLKTGYVHTEVGSIATVVLLLTCWDTKTKDLTFVVP